MGSRNRRTRSANTDAAADSGSGPTERVCAEVRTVYSRLAGRAPQRSCESRTDCCRFRLTGRTPYLTRGEALVAAHAVRATGRRSLPEASGGECPLLDAAGRCLIYEDRPFACRSHFCSAAGGTYPRALVADLIAELDAMDDRLGGSGGVSLPSAVARALTELDRERRENRRPGPRARTRR
jgi:Fe-S-cluster containining protein